MPEATDQRGRGDRGRGVPDDGLVRAERPHRRQDPGRDATPRPRRGRAPRLPPPRAGAPAGRRPQPRPGPRPAPVARADRRRRGPRRDPARPGQRPPATAASGCMVEPLAPDGPDASYAALLRAQHADGLVISGPRVDDPSAGRARPRRLPDRPPGLAARPRRRQRRRRQRRRRARRGRAPVRPRPSADRLHHQRAARLHRRPGAARRAIARRSHAAGIEDRRRS